MSKKLLMLVPLVLLCIGGCGRPNQAINAPLCLNYSSDQAMDAAKIVLQKMQFTLEKDDPGSNYLRTRPLAGAQYFQFWRKDNADAYTAAKANLQSLRRTVEMEFSPKEGLVCIACRVNVQKLSLPEQPIESMHEVAATFTESDRARQSIQISQEQQEKMEWLDEGNDSALEQKILNRIQKQLSKGTK